jgi:hypothetical protein
MRSCPIAGAANSTVGMWLVIPTCDLETGSLASTVACPCPAMSISVPLNGRLTRDPSCIFGPTARTTPRTRRACGRGRVETFFSVQAGPLCQLHKINTR